MKTKDFAQLELSTVVVGIDASAAVASVGENSTVNFAPNISAPCESKESCLGEASRTGTAKKVPRLSRTSHLNEFPIMPDGERLLRINEVAALLRMSDKTVRRMITAGQLTSKKIRGLRLIRWSDLSHFINQSV